MANETQILWIVSPGVAAAGAPQVAGHLTALPVRPRRAATYLKESE